MSKILLILTIVLSIANAAFNYFKLQPRIGDLITAKTNAESSAKTSAASATKAKDEAKAAQEQLSSAKDEAAKATGELTGVKDALTKANSDKSDLQAKLETMQKDLETAKAGGTSTPGQTVPTEDAGKLAELQLKLKEAEAKYAEAQQLTTTLQAKVNEVESQKESLAKYKATREGRLMAKGLEGQVMAVNHGWNFVVVSIGDRKGAVANARLLVKRGDSLVGKVRISSVEPSTSIADIVPDSVPRGQRVMPGDRVIYPGE
jgi:hypothetical protein